MVLEGRLRRSNSRWRSRGESIFVSARLFTVEKKYFDSIMNNIAALFSKRTLLQRTSQEVNAYMIHPGRDMT